MANIGRFQVKSKLGSGGQGSVYLCTDPELQREVAIKLLDRQLDADQSEVQGFLSEARVISRILHPNIVPVFDVGRAGGKPYLVFEYVQGHLLSDYLKRNEPDIPQVLDIFSGMLSGVSEVHRKGLVHRDLKPSNVMLNAEGTPKIMDFGIARMLGPNVGADSVLTGTPRYMAPEYIAEGRVSTQADIFALGAIFYEMLTGRRAFNGKDQKSLLESVIHDRVSAPSTFNPEVRQQLDAVVLKALEKEPSARYADAGDMLSALLEFREADDRTGRKGESVKGTVDFLMRRMQHKSDFPALSESIRTLNRLASSEDEDVGRLASVIIRDFALTNKILKVVNSAYYSRFAGKIGTISRAIVVLGVRTIRSVAASLIFFEHLHNKAQASKLKNEIATAIFSATLARQAAEDAGMERAEEGFLCGMLHNLGKILVTYYLHDESEEVERLVNQEGMNQEQSEKRVLGMTYQEIGVEIARQWNFPDTITRGMVKVDPKIPGNLKNSDIKLRLIANFANEAAGMIGESEAGDDRQINSLLKRYRMSLAISGRRFDEMVEGARQEFRELSGSLGGRADSDPFIQRLSWAPKKQEQEEPTAFDLDTTGKLTKTLALEPKGTRPSAESIQEIVPDGEAMNPEAVLTEGVQEVTGMLLDESVSLTEIFNVVLETIYRAMSYGRVVLVLQDMNRASFSAKLGFGNGIDDFISGFRFSRNYSADVFHVALKNGADLYIGNSGDAKIKKDIPEWYQKISRAGSFYIFPLIVKSKPIGLIYADHPKPGGVKLNDKQLNLIKALRNQVILAFKARM